MRIIFATILCCSLLMNNSFAQNALADLNFEEAEKAYNQRNYIAVLNKLDQVEQAVGTTSKTLYLRIVTQDKMMAQGKHDDKKRDLLDALMDNAKTYLDIMSEYGIDDKFRDVYAIQEKYKNYDGSAASLISREYAVADYQLPDIFLRSYDFSDESRFYQLYPNSKLIAKGEYKDGNPAGYWEWRDETDGLLWRSATYNTDGSVYLFEYSKGHHEARRSNIGRLALDATSILEVRSAFGSKKKKTVLPEDIQQKLSAQQQVTEHGEQKDQIWEVQMSNRRYYGNENYTQNGKLYAKKSWREKNGRKIQEIDIYNENEQIDHKVLYIDGSPVMRIPYENGNMVSAARTEYNLTIRNL